LTAGWNAGAAVVDTVDVADDNIQLVLEARPWAVGVGLVGAVQQPQASEKCCLGRNHLRGAVASDKIADTAVLAQKCHCRDRSRLRVFQRDLEGKPFKVGL